MMKIPFWNVLLLHRLPQIFTRSISLCTGRTSPGRWNGGVINNIIWRCVIVSIVSKQHALRFDVIPMCKYYEHVVVATLLFPSCIHVQDFGIEDDMMGLRPTAFYLIWLAIDRTKGGWRMCAMAHRERSRARFFACNFEWREGNVVFRSVYCFQKGIYKKQ